MADLHEARMQRVLYSFTRISIKWQSQPVDVTTTGWIRYGGMNNGWAGLWEKNILPPQM